MNKKCYNLVAIGLICLFLGVITGFYLGVDITIKKTITLSKMFVTVDLNEDMIKQALFQYYNNIGYCFGNVTA